MNKEELLNNIENQLDTFQVHLKKIKRSEYKMHPIDIDLFRKKILKIYEQLSILELDLINAGEDFYKTINLPEKMPKAEIPEQIKIRKEEKKEAIIEVEQTTENVESDVLTKVEDTETIAEPESAHPPAEEIKPDVESQVDEATKTEFEKPAEPEPKIIPEVAPETNQMESGQPTYAPTESDDPIRSAFDLFTSNAEETIGDKLSSQDESSIADKMQKSHVIDLRQAIGINEKFLFINELFNGDMGRYNKVIDELNGLKTQQGINTYLIELKVSNQWSEDSVAFHKLKDLLERKTS